MRRILITGATGLLGSDLCRLLGQGNDLIGWARRPKRDLALQGRGILESVDITDPEAVTEGIERLRPQIVVHSAAMADVDACEVDPAVAHRVNVDGMENVARACAQVDAILVAISTDYVFDGQLDRPYREEDPAHPLSVYAKSKWEGEKVALQAAPRSCVVRVSGLFGSGRANFVTGAVEAFRQGKPVRVVTDQVNSPSYTLDLAGGFKRLIDFLENGDFSDRILHLANGGGATRMEVARVIAETLEAPDSLIERTIWAAMNRPARRPPNSRLDCSRFIRIAGQPLRSWEDALRDFLKREVS